MAKRLVINSTGIAIVRMKVVMRTGTSTIGVEMATGNLMESSTMPNKGRVDSIWRGRL